MYECWLWSFLVGSANVTVRLPKADGLVSTGQFFRGVYVRATSS